MKHLEEKQSSEPEKKTWQAPTLELIGKNSIKSGPSAIGEVSGGFQS